MVRFIVLLAAALAAAASGAMLPFTARPFMARDFRGTFTLRVGSDVCPRKIFHDKSNKNATLIRHVDMNVNNITCNDNGQLDLFPIEENSTRVENALAPYRNSSPSFSLISTIVANVTNITGSVMGVSSTDRICGPFNLSSGSAVVFVKSETPFSIGGFTVPAGNRTMIYVPLGQNFFCAYSAKPVSSAAEPPTSPPTNVSDLSPTPAASVGNATTNETSTTTRRRPICFPDIASVELADGSFKTMAQVQIGDRVRVEGGKFSDVFMFTHKLSDVKHAFVQLSTASGHTLTLTDGHYLKVNGAMQPAGNVVVGDELTLADGVASAVTRVAVVEGAGLYNPQTVEGTIVVDGVVASTYTTAVEMRTAHCMLSPLRMVYNFFGLSMTALESGADSIASMLPKGSAVY